MAACQSNDLPHVHLFIFDGLSDWEIGHAVAQLNTTSFGQPRYVVRTVAAKPQVVTAGGLTVVADEQLSDVKPQNSAMLILPGGGSWDRGGNAEAVDLARQFLEASVPVAAICGATAGLARGGLLDGRRHTSNSRAYLAATGYAGGAYFQDAPVVTDGQLVTAGAMRPVEFARAILELLEVYSGPLLDAWYGLFSTGDASYFDAALAAAGNG